MEKTFVVPNVEMSPNVEQLKLIKVITIWLKELLIHKKIGVLGFCGPKIDTRLIRDLFNSSESIGCYIGSCLYIASSVNVVLKQSS